MSKLILSGAMALILTAAVTGCMPKPQQQARQQAGNGDPYAQNQQAYNQPVNPNQPAPYLQPANDVNGPAQWPGAAAGNAPGNTPGNFVQGPGNRPGDNPGALTLDSAPAGMRALPSQAGHVFRVELTGTGPLPQQSRDFYMKLMPYFDAQPQVMGYLDDPSGRMAQVGFQATKGGAPVMGMLMVTQGQNGHPVATVMLDTPDRFQQSMQTMMAATQQP